jgi:hypothetical protein
MVRTSPKREKAATADGMFSSAMISITNCKSNK